MPVLIGRRPLQQPRPVPQIETTRSFFNKPTKRFVYKKGTRWPATVVLAAPFALLILPMLKFIRRKMNWHAILATILTFEGVMFILEHIAIRRGHWVWNESRILGWKIAGVPVEEPFFYYWLGPIFVVTIFLSIRHRVQRSNITK
jgi:lycopene cyclase domain-containing protein